MFMMVPALLWLCAAHLGAAILLVERPDGSQATVYDAPFYFAGQGALNGTVVRQPLPSASCAMDASRTTGSIVIIDTDATGCQLDRWASECERVGCLGIIVHRFAKPSPNSLRCIDRRL